MYSPATTIRIINFLRSIGIAVDFATITKDTFLPGVAIQNGGLVIDSEKMKYPGDLLHEAGHIAITPAAQRAALTDNVDKMKDSDGIEMAAIAWSYAACKHLGFASSLVFHPHGYKGDSDSLIENFDNGKYFGVPMLQWHGMANEPAQASEFNTDPYPAMVNWLSQQ